MVCTGWGGLCVTAEKTKIYPHLRVVKILIHKMFPKDQTNLRAYAVYFLICPPCDWRGARVLSIPFIKQHLY